MLGYFTVTTNLLIAIVFIGIAARSAVFERPWLVGGTLLNILLAGTVYALLLRGLTAGSEPASFLLRQVTPLLEVDPVDAPWTGRPNPIDSQSRASARPGSRSAAW